MSIKGFPTQEKFEGKLDGFTEEQSSQKSEFATLQKTYSKRVGLDTVQMCLYRVNPTVSTVSAINSANPKRVFQSTAHGAQVGDVVRFEDTSSNAGFESQVLSVPDANTIVLAGITPDNIQVSDDFYILRYTTPRVDETGATIVTISAAPIQFVLDGTDTEVSKDTVTPADSRPLPVEILDAGGNPIDPATEGTLQNLSNIAANLATQDALLDVVANTANIASKDFATQTTLAALNAKVTAVNTGAVTISAPLPAGTNNIGDVDVLSLPSIPAGTNNIGDVDVLTLPISYNAGATDATTQRVIIANNQTAVPVTSTVTDITATGTITTQNLVPAGVATAGSAVASGSLNGNATALVQVTGAYTGALSLQFTVDGTTWVTAGGTVFLNVNTGVYSATIASAAQGIFQVDVSAANQFRITGLAAMTGTATVSLRASRAASMVSLDNPIPAGTNIIGALVANQSTNVAQINGVAPLMGAGPSGTGSHRTTIANFATATAANVTGSASSVTLLAAAAARAGATFYNDSTAILYLKFGATASTTSFTAILQPNDYYELPGPHIYSGVIDGIWSSAAGACRVTSW